MSRHVPGSDKTYREHLQAVQSVHKVTPEELENHPESPPRFPWLWDWFKDFNSPITWAEIRAWESGDYKVQRWEGEILIRLDRIRNE